MGARGGGMGAKRGGGMGANRGSGMESNETFSKSRLIDARCVRVYTGPGVRERMLAMRNRYVLNAFLRTCTADGRLLATGLGNTQ